MGPNATVVCDVNCCKELRNPIVTGDFMLRSESIEPGPGSSAVMNNSDRAGFLRRCFMLMFDVDICLVVIIYT